ncbi:MAG: hypothetical protein JNK82_14045 [Myxococcaceae bacterium]|nr:hypothetical protein [Myxococcaceae bacterium]
MRRFLPLLLLVIAAAPPAARAVRVKLGGTISDIEGETAPWPGGAKPLPLHALKGPVELTVEFPSGRTYRAVTRDPTVLIAEPTTRVRGVTVGLGVFETWGDAVTAIERELDVLGLPAGGERDSRWRLREKRVNHPSWPLEGCITVTATNFDKSSKKVVVVLELGESTPQVWHTVHGKHSTDTCPLSSGP